MREHPQPKNFTSDASYFQECWNWEHEKNAKLKQERDELAAMVEVMRAFILKVSQQKPEKPDHWNSCGQCECNENEAYELLSITPSDALREIQARTLEEASLILDEHESKLYSSHNLSGPSPGGFIRELAAAKRKGE